MKVGLQLYSIRDLLEQDLDAALKAVSEAGYQYVEFAGFYGKTAAQINELLSRYGLCAISVHQGYQEIINNDGGILDFLKEIGIKYSAVPYMAHEKHKGAADYEETILKYKKASENLKKYDIQMLYHNHDFEFNTYDGKYLNDWLIESVGVENIYPELDTCWAKYAGVAPDKYILKYSGKIPVVHLKDFTGNIGLGRTQEENNFRLQPVGSGCQDWYSILEACEKAGTQYVIVEQDEHYGADPIMNIKKSRSFLEKAGY